MAHKEYGSLWMALWETVEVINVLVHLKPIHSTNQLGSKPVIAF